MQAMQNFNMAAIFQDGHHGLSWNPIFAYKGQQMVEKDNYDNKFYVLGIANVQIMLYTLFKCSDPFNMAANIHDGLHRLSFIVIVS